MLPTYLHYDDFAKIDDVWLIVDLMYRSFGKSVKLMEVKPKSTPRESAKCRFYISGCERSKGESKTKYLFFLFLDARQWARDKVSDDSVIGIRLLRLLRADDESWSNYLTIYIMHNELGTDPILCAYWIGHLPIAIQSAWHASPGKSKIASPILADSDAGGRLAVDTVFMNKSIEIYSNRRVTFALV